MANKIYIDVVVDDKGTTKKVAVDAQKLEKNLKGVSKGSRTVDRNMKGTSKQSANATKNFSKMSQGISGTLVPAYAALASNIFALSAAYVFLKDASDVKNLELSQISYAKSTGMAIQSVTSRLREASGGMLGFREAAQSAAIGIASGLGPNQLNELAEGARKASNALGRDFEDAFNRLVRGVTKAEPELLDDLGIKLRLTTATEDYAAAIGKSVDKLTEAQRSQAIFIKVQKQLIDQFGAADAAPNPFITMGKSLRDLIDMIVQSFLPIFETLAKVIDNNRGVALAFFGVIASSVVKGITGSEGLTASLKEMESTQSAAMNKARQDMVRYQVSIATTASSLSQVRKELQIIQRTGASKAINAGAKSPLLDKAQAGTLSSSDQENLNKALKAAEASHQRHGKIVRGIFKGVSIDIVRSMKYSTDAIVSMNTVSAEKVIGPWQKFGIRFKQVMLGTQMAATRAQMVITRAAQKTVGAVNKAMKGLLFIGIITMIWEAFQKVMNAPYDFALSILNGVAWLVKSVGKVLESGINLILDGVTFVVNGIIDFLNDGIMKLNAAASLLPKAFQFEIPTIPSVGEDALKVTLNLAKKVDKALEDAKFAADWLANLKVRQDAAQQVLRFKAALEELGDSAKTASKDIDSALKGIGEALDKGDTVGAGKARATSIGTLNIADLIQKATSFRYDESLDPKVAEEQVQAALAEIEKNIGNLEGLSPRLMRALRAGDADDARLFASIASTFIGNLESLEDGIASIGTQLQGSSLTDIRLYIENLENIATSAKSQADEMGIATNVLKLFDDAFAKAGGSTVFKNRLILLEEQQKNLKQSQSDLAISTMELDQLQGASQEEAKNALNLRKAALALAETELERTKVLEMQRSGLINNPSTAAALEKELEALELVREQRLDSIEQAQRAMDEMAQAGLKMGGVLETSMGSAFSSIVQGTETVKGAFLGMAQSILKALADIITQMLVVKLLQSALGGTSFGGFLGISSATPAAAATEIPVPAAAGVAGTGISVADSFAGGFAFSGAKGGVADGPKSGFPALLHGTEAVVPLPDNKSIPVDLKGATGQQNNVTVNVVMDNNGQAETTTESGMNGNKLGAAIAKAVQQELQNQKRSGGILSPYGAS